MIRIVLPREKEDPMKRVILRVVVMLLTFALGVMAYLLIIERVSNNAPLTLKDEAVSPAAPASPVAPVVPIAAITSVPAATPKPHFILDYDPDTFYPYGMYHLMGPKRGVLTRSKDSRALVERTVSFRFEFMGC